MLSLLLLLATLTWSCEPVAPAPTRPAAQAVDVVGVVASVDAGGDWIRYRLADGRVWERTTGAFRVVYDRGGPGGLLVVGHDGRGWYVVVAGSQEGLPAECRWAIGNGGREWGDAVEIEGLLWPRSAAFSTTVGTAPIAGTYPTAVRFCLNERGQLSTAVSQAP